MKKEELKAANELFVDTSLDILNYLKLSAQKQCEKTLKILGGSVDFDWKDNDAPCLTSVQFTDDIVDCYITKAYVDGYGNIYVNLHAYYLGDDLNDVLLANEPNADYIDLLECLNSKL